ncbi:MAG: LysM peptidoglycan-binding domain-containing protein [Verrucomicrobiales bacterium]|nr:LysM peptidoglycan-binding domain-containing protein [Verrucomicrobiales bacterium]MCP5557431.1 LysM peptidoglycan-binding domain-containing protein [Verrucomicrobiaceae bacterium]
MKPEPTVKKKKKKADLLRNLLGAEKHRHQVATITEEGEWNQHEPNGGMARVFVVMLLLHVFLIGGIILYDFIGTDEGASQTTHSVISSSAVATTSAAPISSSVNVTAPPVGEWDTYEVKSGDSLPNIAAKLGVDEAELIRLNELDGSVSLQPHGWLRIPNKKIAEPAKMATIASLPALNANVNAATPVDELPAPKAEAFTPMDTTPPEVTELSTTSNMADKTPVVVTPLAVDTPPAAPPAPEPAVVETPAPKATPVAPKPSPVPPPSLAARKVEPTPPPAPAKKPAPTPTKARSHTVAKGDTLYSMARTYGVSVSAIQKANGIKDPTTVRMGAKLVIPAQ